MCMCKFWRKEVFKWESIYIIGGSTTEASSRPRGFSIAVTFKRATYYEVQWVAAWCGAVAEHMHTLHISKV